MFKVNAFKKEAFMYVVHAYIAYLLVSLAVTVWVARTLHKNGRVFLLEAFHGNNELADSVNHLLVVGFYLVNLGWMVSAVESYYPIDTPRTLIEFVSHKTGTILLVLGAMHFLNMFVLNKFRRRAQERYMPPPIPQNYQVNLG